MSLPKLYLHIGSPKTGSSTLQRYLGKNRTRLEWRGIVFPSLSNRVHGHHALASHYAANPYQWVETQSKADLIKKIHSQFNSVEDAHSLILSAEGFWGMRDIDVFAKDFENFDVHIVAFLRRQDDLIESLYRQSAKYNHDIPRAEVFFRQRRAVLDYKDRLQKWESVTEPEKIKVIPYRPKHWTSSIEEIFLRQIGVQGKVFNSFTNIDLANLSFNADCLRYLHSLGQDIDLRSRKLRNLHLTLSKYSKTIAKNRKDSWFYPAKRRKSILRQYQEGNDFVTERYTLKKRLFNKQMDLDREVADLKTPLGKVIENEIYAFCHSEGIDPLNPIKTYKSQPEL